MRQCKQSCSSEWKHLRLNENENKLSNLATMVDDMAHLEVGGGISIQKEGWSIKQLCGKCSTR